MTPILHRFSAPARRTSTLALLAVAALLAMAAPLAAGTIYVDANRSGSNPSDGAGWSSAYRSLQSALAEATAGDEIWIAEGDYFPDKQEDGSNSTDPTVTFDLPDGVSLYGGFAGDETSRSAADPDAHPTILDGNLGLNKAYHVVTAGTNITLSGLTIRNGDATDAPTEVDDPVDNDTSGAIFLTDPANTITLQDMILEDNKAWEGAVTKGGNWTVDNSIFRDNDADNVGGVARGGTWQVDDSLFLRNTADSAGVFFNGTWTVRDSAFRENTALGSDREISWPFDTANRGGGGVASGVGGPPAYELTAINTEFSGNGADTAGVASALANTNDSFTVDCTNCLFKNNYAFEAGVSRGGTWNVVQNVFVGNAAITGAGVAVGGKWTAELSTFAGNGVGFSEPRLGRTAANWDRDNPASWTIRDSVFADKEFVPTNDPFAEEYHLDITYPGGFPSYNLITQEIATANEVRLTNLLGGLTGPDDNPLLGTYLLTETAASPFADINDPDGPDNTWGTADDGLRLREGSPAADLGESDLRLVTDAFDLDDDNDTSESLPIDFSIIRALSTEQATSFNRPRALSADGSARYDLGAYEGTALTLTFETNTDSATISPSGALPWAQFYLKEVSATDNAPSGAMLFDQFSAADASAGSFPFSGSSSTSEANPSNYLPTASTTITAEYTPDTNDDDNDGLTNYDEIAVHGSDPAQVDSSGDGIEDGTAVESGLDPTTAYDGIVSDIQTNLVDLRAGSKRITPTAEGKLRIELQLERSTDLQTWTDGPTVTHEVTPDAPTEFYRFRLE